MFNTRLFSVDISTKLNKHLKTAKLYDQTIKHFLFSSSFFMKNQKSSYAYVLAVIIIFVFIFEKRFCLIQVENKLCTLVYYFC